jgi:tetratricopeptide (TPR) repeat protein
LPGRSEVVTIDPPGKLDRLRQIAQERPFSPAAHANLGTALLRMGRPSEAEKELRRALELKPDLAEALVNLGGILFARWDYHGCVEANKKAAAANPGLLAAHYGEGLGHLYLGEAQEVVACFQRALEIEGGHAGSHYHLALGLLALGRVAESRASLEEALRGGFSPTPEFLKALEKEEGRPSPESEIRDRDGAMRSASAE